LPERVSLLGRSLADLVRLDEFLDVARDKSDEFPDFQEWDGPCFDPGIQRPQGDVQTLGSLYFI